MKRKIEMQVLAREVVHWLHHCEEIQIELHKAEANRSEAEHKLRALLERQRVSQLQKARKRKRKAK